MTDQIQPHIRMRYQQIRKIGSGAYGHVYRVQQPSNPTPKALKKNFDAFSNPTDAQRTYRQISFLLLLSHPNIITLQQILPSQSPKDIYLVFENMDADLHRLVREGLLGSRHRKYILWQVAKALFYLHSGGLVHRDLKPSNVLVNESCLAKVCDFGLVRSLGDNEESDQAENGDSETNDGTKQMTQYIATRWYRAPEILLGSRKYSKGIDIWGFGCLAAQMMRNRPLFPGTSTLNQLQRILSWTGPPTKSDLQSMPSATKQMLSQLAHVKAVSRQSYFPQIDVELLDLISRCLEFNPKKRITIQEILLHPYLREFYVESEILKCDRKIKLPVDDYVRLSAKEYQRLIYEEMRKRADGNGYRIKEKSKKSVRTQESEPAKQPVKNTVPNPKKSATLSSSKPSKTMPLNPLSSTSLPKKLSTISSHISQMPPLFHHSHNHNQQSRPQSRLFHHKLPSSSAQIHQEREHLLAEVRRSSVFREGVGSRVGKRVLTEGRGCEGLARM